MYNLQLLTITFDIQVIFKTFTPVLCIWVTFTLSESPF